MKTKQKFFKKMELKKTRERYLWSFEAERTPSLQSKSSPAANMEIVPPATSSGGWSSSCCLQPPCLLGGTTALASHKALNMGAPWAKTWTKMAVDGDGVVVLQCWTVKLLACWTLNTELWSCGASEPNIWACWTLNSRLLSCWAAILSSYMQELFVS